MKTYLKNNITRLNRSFEVAFYYKFAKIDKTPLFDQLFVKMSC